MFHHTTILEDILFTPLTTYKSPGLIVPEKIPALLTTYCINFSFSAAQFTMQGSGGGFPLFLQSLHIYNTDQIFYYIIPSCKSYIRICVNKNFHIHQLRFQNKLLVYYMFQSNWELHNNNNNNNNNNNKIYIALFRYNHDYNLKYYQIYNTSN